MLLVDALYINNSGGKVLLDYLITSLLERKTEAFFLLDKRCEASYLDLNIKNVTFVEATLKNRKEFYKNDNKKFTHIFCFANLAPPIKCDGQVTTYFHNLLLSEIPSGTPVKKRLLLLLKRMFAKRVCGNSDLFVVQTGYAKDSFISAYGHRQVEIIPFYNDFGIVPGLKQPNTFLYVSDGNSHKNHATLIKAWRYVSSKEAELWLTISDAYPTLQDEIANLQNEGYKVYNHKNLKRSELNALYAKAEYLLYPSLLESFGLGLIEGALAGCKVLSSDLPFAYQVVQPSAVFNPHDIVSIASRIKEAADSQIFAKTVLKAHDEIDKLIRIISEK
ncbi:MAG TPA: glycosyltransferase [Cytophagales bacterium]|nr:glycosyltransferase [Cytophagales bacterium]